MFRKNRSGFTLLEVILAVAILAMVGLGIYRFVETSLTATRISAISAREEARVEALEAYLRARMQALPSARAGAIFGEPHRFKNISSDELGWIARPGSGLLTRHAVGEWWVTLTIRPLAKGEHELGMRCQDLERKRDAEWLPLMRGVRGFEVRYFDPVRREWLEKWTEPKARPALVRVKLWRDPEREPFEMVLPVSAKTTEGGSA